MLFLLALTALCSAHNVELLPVNDASAFSESYTLGEPAWQVFKTVSGSFIVELTTELPSGTRFINPEAHDGPELAVEDVTDCASTITSRCVQNFYFISEEALVGSTADGVMGVEVESENDNTTLSLHFVYSIDLTDVSSDSTRSLLTANGRPVLENAFEFANYLTEGTQACVIIKHNSPIQLYSARVCTLLGDDIDSTVGDGCDSLLDDMVGTTLFDSVESYTNELWAVDPRQSDNQNQMEFCFDPQKLSAYQHLLEVQLVELTGRRGMLSIGFGVPQSFTVECEEDLLFDPGTHVCTVTSPHSLAAGWFIAFTIILVFCCLVAYCSVANTHPEGWHLLDKIKPTTGENSPSMPGLKPMDEDLMRMDDKDLAYYLPELVSLKAE